MARGQSSIRRVLLSVYGLALMVMYRAFYFDTDAGGYWSGNVNLKWPRHDGQLVVCRRQRLCCRRTCGQLPCNSRTRRNVSGSMFWSRKHVPSPRRTTARFSPPAPARKACSERQNLSASARCAETRGSALRPARRSSSVALDLTSHGLRCSVVFYRRGGALTPEIY